MIEMFEHKPFVESDAAFDELLLSAFSAGLKRIFLPGGQILFRENEAADTFYIVISGCLGVIVRCSNGPNILVTRITAGETVGEMGLLDGGVRSATVEALRDTELLKFDKAKATKICSCEIQGRYTPLYCCWCGD
jgi:NTE family protein